MVQTALLDTLAARMNRGDTFCYRTDDRPYFDWTVEHLEANPHWQIDATVPWPFEERSFFQDLMSEWHSLVARRA